MSPTKFRLYRTGPRRKYPWAFAAMLVGLWLAGAGTVFLALADEDWRLVAGMFWAVTAIPISVFLLRAPCVVEGSDQGFTVKIIRSAPLVPKTTQTHLWAEMYQFEYRGFYQHEYVWTNKTKDVGFVTIYLHNGDPVRFQGRQADQFYYYLKGRFPDKQHYPY